MKRQILLTDEDIREFTEREAEMKQEIELLLDEAFPERIFIRKPDEKFDIEKYT